VWGKFYRLVDGGYQIGVSISCWLYDYNLIFRFSIVLFLHILLPDYNMVPVRLQLANVLKIKQYVNITTSNNKGLRNLNRSSKFLSPLIVSAFSNYYSNQTQVFPVHSILCACGKHACWDHTVDLRLFHRMVLHDRS